VLRIRLQVEQVLAAICRQKGVRMPEVTDDELARLPDPPERMDVFRFVVAKLGETR
jgi:hypothetical protein